MKFEYQQVVTALNEIDIVDIGNCCIMAKNALDEEYYLVIRTSLGWTEIIRYGPIIPDFKQLPPCVSYTYDRIEYKEGRIISSIEKFLLPPRIDIVEAKECDITYVKNNIKNFIEKIMEDN